MTRTILFALAALAVLAFGAGPVLAQSGTANLLGKHDANAPIAVSANNFDGDFKTKVGTYTGNVVVTQGTFKLRADTVTVTVKEGKPDRITANGHVVFVSDSGAATGDTGVYDLVPRTITLTGDVVLTKEKNVMHGTSLVVNLTTGEAKLNAKGMPGGRVQGLFTPPPQQQQKQKPAGKKPSGTKSKGTKSSGGN